MGGKSEIKQSLGFEGALEGMKKAEEIGVLRRRHLALGSAE